MSLPRLQDQAPVQHDQDDARILVVEDDPFIRDALESYLLSEGFIVDMAENGDEMRQRLENAVPTVVIMDLKLPGETGIELTRYLREHYTLGIIILTTKAELVDRVVGLEVGADDYLTKPYEPRELLARIRSLLRRLQISQETENSPENSSTPNKQKYRFAGCILDNERRCLIGKDGESHALTSSEIRLLNVLAEHPFRTVSRDDLMQAIYQREWSPVDRSIDVLVTKVRRKLDSLVSDAGLIRSVRGVGYELAADVTAD